MQHYLHEISGYGKNAKIKEGGVTAWKEQNSAGQDIYHAQQRTSPLILAPLFKTTRHDFVNQVTGEAGQERSYKILQVVGFQNKSQLQGRAPDSLTTPYSFKLGFGVLFDRQAEHGYDANGNRTAKAVNKGLMGQFRAGMNEISSGGAKRRNFSLQLGRKGTKSLFQRNVETLTAPDGRRQITRTNRLGNRTRTKVSLKPPKR
jgi:hypothetical protein